MILKSPSCEQVRPFALELPGARTGEGESRSRKIGIFNDAVDDIKKDGQLLYLVDDDPESVIRGFFLSPDSP